MRKTLLLVESPNKARKIQSFLGADVAVRASVGHICDLPEKGYGVDLATFEETYEVRKADVVAELRRLVRSGGYERVLLATDPDREGEAIAWHLARELKLGVAAPRRVEFREITPDAVRRAMDAPRPIDEGRVDAQRSRRVLDRIVGFDVSGEICWPAGATSAGRVQTPALHILCEREREILAFVAEQYWTLEVEYHEGFVAFVPEGGDRNGGDQGPGTGDRNGSAKEWPDTEENDDAEPFAERTRPPSAGTRPSAERQPDSHADATGAPPPDSTAPRARLRPRRFSRREEAQAAEREARRHPHIVRSVERRRTERRPDPPYTTSTMQQDASRKLRLSAKEAADLAQQLFEAGYITYHRTDSTRVSDEAVEMAREHIGREHPEALPGGAARAARGGKAKAGVQDAHEAIRPTKLAGDDAPPPAAAKLYAMIRARFLASQCRPAVIDRTNVWIDSGPIEWLAQGAVLVEPGYLVYWRPYARQEDELLPAVAPNQVLAPRDYDIEEKSTTPPSRYDTGGLIRKLEVSGIGRPSTFASIIETLLRRDYVREMVAGRGKKVLEPTEHGMRVDGLLTETFPDLVSEAYTARMEGEIDRIEKGAGETRVGYLSRWYADFRRAMSEALPRATRYRQEHKLAARPRAGRGEETKMPCDRCGEASYVKVARKGGKGSFLACPACSLTRDVRARTKPAGCPKCGSTLVERRGRKKGVKFFGCVRYGAAEHPCDYAEFGSSASSPASSSPAPSAERRAPRARFSREPTTKPCPRCGAHELVILRPASEQEGKPYYACSDSACRFTLTVGARRRAAPCPECGGVVIERQARAKEGQHPLASRAFWSCARYPKCHYSASMAPPQAPDSLSRVAPTAGGRD
ncbi:MAG TPA: type I DNA topoisomerase [Gemmatimonadaceae bacterium]